MGYYSDRGDCMYGRGDYYQGDYYRGDPGLFGSLKKALGGAVRGFITGGPLGAVGGAVGALTKFNPKQGTALAPAGEQLGLPRSRTRIQLLPPSYERESFGPEIMQQPQGTLTPQGEFIPGCQLPGFRKNKSSYFRAVPGQPGVGVLVPKGSVCVKSRRLNVANPRALRRAIRRAQGFAKLSRRVLSFVSAKAPKGRPRFKRKRA